MNLRLLTTLAARVAARVTAWTAALAFLTIGCRSTPPPENPWEYTLGAAGANDKDFDVGGFRGSGSAGRYLNDSLLVGLRQDVSFADGQGIDSDWNGSSRIFLDQHIGSARLRPFIGANIGWVYGDSVKETGAAAPEAGLKWTLSDDAFLFVLGEYQFFFEEADEADEAFDDGQFVYSLGIGLRF